MKEEWVAKLEKSELVQSLVSLSGEIGTLQNQLEILHKEMVVLQQTAKDPTQTQSGLPYASPHQRLAYLKNQSDQLLKSYAQAMAHLRQVVEGNETMLREEAHAPELAVLGRLM